MKNFIQKLVEDVSEQTFRDVESVYDFILENEGNLDDDDVYYLLNKFVDDPKAATYILESIIVSDMEDEVLLYRLLERLKKSNNVSIYPIIMDKIGKFNFSDPDKLKAFLDDMVEEAPKEFAENWQYVFVNDLDMKDLIIKAAKKDVSILNNLRTAKVSLNSRSDILNAFPDYEEFDED